MEYQGIAFGDYAPIQRDNESDVLPILNSGLEMDIEEELAKLVALRSLMDSPGSDQDTDPECPGTKPMMNELRDFCTTYKEVRRQYQDLLREKEEKEEKRNQLRTALNDIKTKMHIDLNMVEEYHEDFQQIAERLEAVTAMEMEKLDLPGTLKRLEQLSRFYDQAVPLIKFIHEQVVNPGQHDVINACPVCYEASVDTVFVPCGHTVCSRCKPRGRTGTCHLCRSQVSQCVKIYL